MKPYGRRKHDELEYIGGPPSKCRKITSKHRTASRRILHKQARNDSKDILQEELDDNFDLSSGASV